MTGSACRSTFRYAAALYVSCRKKEMILRRLGEGFGEGKGTVSRLRGASADDGKRVSESTETKRNVS